MTRKPGRPPLPRDGTTIRRLPVHATDNEYEALMKALHADTRERFFQVDGAVNGYNIHVDEMLQVLREVKEWQGNKPDWLHDMIDNVLDKYNAVTGVTPTQEGSNE